MGFKKEIKEKALLACKRHCVLCEKRKDLKMECHHITPQALGGDDSFDNCIPLCFDCHQEIGSYNPLHPKGNQFSTSELKKRRNDFYKRVKNGEFPKQNTFPNHMGLDRSIKKCDIEIIEKIKKEFSSENLKYYLTEYDLGNDYNIEVFNPLNNLFWQNNDPNFSFIDIELEKYKNNLLASIDKFITFRCLNTFPTKLGTQAIKTWKNDNYTDEERSKINNEFNDLASNIWENYCSLIKVYKSKL